LAVHDLKSLAYRIKRLPFEVKILKKFFSSDQIVYFSFECSIDDYLSKPELESLNLIESIKFK
jgi:hypothetical protein